MLELILHLLSNNSYAATAMHFSACLYLVIFSSFFIE